MYKGRYIKYIHNDWNNKNNFVLALPNHKVSIVSSCI